MAARQHRYEVALDWTGNTGVGTSAYTAYDRSYSLQVAGKPPLLGSSDPAFRGDASRWNPEELLVASLSACHQLWYLHLCAEAGVIVLAYEDRATGLMDEASGQFTAVVLHPLVTVSPRSLEAEALRLHDAAHERCFIARSVRFPVTHQAAIRGGVESKARGFAPGPH